MNRKRINIIIAIALIFFYGVSIVVLYNSSKIITIQNFEKEKQNAVQYIYEEESRADINEIQGIDHFLQSIDNRLESISAPYYITVFDPNTSEKVAQTKSYIQIFNCDDGTFEICDIDKYLTDDIKKQISDLQNDSCIFQAQEFSYNKSKNEIIPVKIKIYNTYSEKSCELVFSNDKAEFNIKNAPDADSKYLISASIFDFTNDYKHGCYEYMRKHIDLEKTFWNGGFEDNDEMQNMFLISVPEKSGKNEYMLYFQMKNDTFAVTIASYYFYEKFGFITAFYSITAVLTLVLVNIYITKKKRLDDVQYAFINAAAHELKTPLSVIQNQCECILENTAGDKTNDYVSSIYQESIKMSRLTSGFLDYNKLMLKDRIKRKRYCLADIVNDEIDKYDSFAKSKEIKFSVDIDKSAYAHCNKELIEKGIDNLLSNAVKYSPQGSMVKINLKKEHKAYKFSVVNETDCDTKLEDNIWEPLIVSDKSRRNNSTGMGLTLAKKIFELHKAKYGFNQMGKTVEFYFIID